MCRSWRRLLPLPKPGLRERCWSRSRLRSRRRVGRRRERGRCTALAGREGAAPPDGAAAESVTVHVDAAPEVSVAGAQSSEDMVGSAGWRVTEAVLELLLN